MIPQERFGREKQRVKMFIADNNVFGVDRNPVAVELAEVSLWLNSIFEGAYVPWFGMQLVTGNSLVGARRQVFNAGSLGRNTGKLPSWLDSVPERVMPGEARPDNTVYHFLLPDRGMADYKDKVVPKMAEGEFKKIREWRKKFTDCYSDSAIERLKKLSAAVDELWKRHIGMQRNIRIRTSDKLSVFGKPSEDMNPIPTTTDWKDKIFDQELLSVNIRNSSPYRRLKLVMDYWCALWFWSIEKGEDGFATIHNSVEDLIVKNMVAEGLPLGSLWYSDCLDER